MVWATDLLREARLILLWGLYMRLLVASPGFNYKNPPVKTPHVKTPHVKDPKSKDPTSKIPRQRSHDKDPLSNYLRQKWILQNKMRRSTSKWMGGGGGWFDTEWEMGWEEIGLEANLLRRKSQSLVGLYMRMLVASPGFNCQNPPVKNPTSKTPRQKTPRQRPYDKRPHVKIPHVKTPHVKTPHDKDPTSKHPCKTDGENFQAYWGRGIGQRLRVKKTQWTIVRCFVFLYEWLVFSNYSTIFFK